MKTTVWAITFEPAVVEISGWLQNVADERIPIPIDLKIGTTKYPIIKHMRFSLTFFICANNEDIGPKFLPDTYDHTLMS